MRRYEAMLLAYDTATSQIVRISDQQPEYWIARAYGGTRQIICLLCAHGYDIAAPQSVPLIHKGRIGGRVRRHWSHPASTGPESGHSPESVWHLHAKLFATEWAKALPNVAHARMEIPTADRARRSDVLVTLADGAALALEPHCYSRTDEEWRGWLADHRAAGIVPVLLLHPELPPAHVLWAEGHSQVWQLHLTIAETGDSALLAAFLGDGHARTSWWWEGDLAPHAPHRPPCAGDAVTVTDGFTFRDLALDADGIRCPSLERLIDEGRRRIAVEAAAVRRRIEAERQKERQRLERLKRQLRALLAVTAISAAQYRQAAELVWAWLDAHRLPVGDDPPRWPGDMARLCERASGHVGRLGPLTTPVAVDVCRHTGRGSRALWAVADDDERPGLAATACFQGALTVIARHQGLEDLQPTPAVPAQRQRPERPALAAAVCGCTEPQLVVRIEDHEYLAMPSAQFGPVSALYVARCRSCGGPYHHPWRRVLVPQPV